MMKIKFRAWYEGEMWSVRAISFDRKDVVDLENDRAQSCVTWPEGETWEKDLTLMQFTGLHDKNGTEIYEGDIINSEGQMVREVFYSSSRASFMVRIPGSGSEYNFYINPINHFVVIGNIHQHPELLEAE